jgi:hypothetical protein
MVVHAQSDTRTLKVIDDKVLFGGSVCWGKNKLQAARSIHDKICGLVLVTKGMTSQDNGFCPPGHQPRNVLAENGFTENCASKDIADGTLIIIRIVIMSNVALWQKKQVMQLPELTFGDFHICFNLNSITRASSGVMVAHLMPTLCFLMACAASMVTWSLVRSRSWMPRS